MAIEKKIVIDTNEATNNIEKLEKALNKTTKTEEQLVKTTPNAEKGVEELGNSFERTSQQAENFRQKTDAVQKVSAGLQGAFGMAVGAIALFGNESEKLTQVMTKLSSVMLITNNLKALGEGFKGLSDYVKLASKEGKIFNTVMKASIIGAVIAAVGFLVANFDDLRKRFALINTVAEKATEIFNGLTGVFSNIVPIISNLGKTIGLALVAPIRTIIDGYEAVGKIIKAVFEGDFENIPNITKNALSDIKKNFTEVGDAAKAMSDDISKSYKKGIVDAANQAKQLTPEELQALKERRAKIKEEQASLSEELRRAQMSDKQREYDDLELWNKKAVAQSHNNKELLLKVEEEYRKRKQALDEKYDELDKQAELERQQKELERLNSELDIQSARNKYNNRNNEEEYLKEQLEIEKEKITLIDEGTQAWYAQAEAIATLEDKLKDLKLKALNDEQQRLVDDLETNVGRVNALANSIGGIFDAVMSSMDENSEAYKGLAITQTIIQTLVGMMTALSGAFTTKSGPWDIALAAVQAASIMAGGIATINQIASANESTNLNGASASIVSGSRVSDNAVQGVTQSTQNLPSITPMSEMSRNDDTRVYVLTTDIQRKDKQLNTKRSEVRF